ncbi:MAG: hypothetical protein JO270_09415 [Acidobacteriaceae bacterium]|nr:hypothetical protein [Acidobacteriaceae bacterium]
MPDGVDAGGYRYTPAPAAPPWNAPWIWLPGGTPKDCAAAYFRKNITLDALPQRVMARISADTIYRLYVNGRMVSRGPADPGNDFAPHDRWSHQWLYDLRDLTPFFEKGMNVIAAEVFTKGEPNYSLGKHGFVLEAEIDVPGKPRVFIATGPDWRALSSTAWSIGRVHAGGSERVTRFVSAIRCHL